MYILRKLYTFYAIGIFALVFIAVLPFFFIFIPIKALHPLARKLNYWWAKLFFVFIFMPVQIIYKQPLNPKNQYVFCANHFSYLDIPILGLSKVAGMFIGKASLKKLPIFGYMFSQLHITVDRSSRKDRYSALIEALAQADKGQSLFIFPEGGIRAKHPPTMESFKDGAFRIAIEKNIPIVPTSIMNAWQILPEHSYLLKWGRLDVVYHEPIKTENLTLADLDSLKKQVYSIIDKQLNSQNA